MKNLWSFAIISLVLFLGSCKEDPPPAPQPPSTDAVIIGCEGLTASGSSTLAEYDPKSKTLINNVFQKANTSPLGNVIHSMLVDDDKIFLVMTGAREIVIVDRETYKVIDRIESLGAPRHIMKINDNKYYITDWQEEGVLVYSLNAGEVVRKVITGKGPENMVLYENMAFIANGGDGNPDTNLTVINTDRDTILKQIKVGINPNSLQIDQNNMLWVLCSGQIDQNPVNSIRGNLASLNLDQDSLIYRMDSLVVIDSLEITDNQMRPQRLTINNDGDMLYWLDQPINANLMSFNVFSAASPTTTPFISGTFYGLGIDPIEDDIYLSDAADEVGNGDVYRFDVNGGQQDQKTVGIKPVCFGFK